MDVNEKLAVFVEEFERNDSIALRNCNLCMLAEQVSEENQQFSASSFSFKVVSQKCHYMSAHSTKSTTDLGEKRRRTRRRRRKLCSVRELKGISSRDSGSAMLCTLSPDIRHTIQKEEKEKKKKKKDSKNNNVKVIAFGKLLLYTKQSFQNTIVCNITACTYTTKVTPCSRSAPSNSLPIQYYSVDYIQRTLQFTVNSGGLPSFVVAHF